MSKLSIYNWYSQCYNSYCQRVILLNNAGQEAERVDNGTIMTAVETARMSRCLKWYGMSAEDILSVIDYIATGIPPEEFGSGGENEAANREEKN